MVRTVFSLLLVALVSLFQLFPVLSFAFVFLLLLLLSVLFLRFALLFSSLLSRFVGCSTVIGVGCRTCGVT